MFSVSSCRDSMCWFSVSFAPFDWVKWAPKKVNIFAWRAEQNRLATLKGLQRRNVIVARRYADFAVKQRKRRTIFWYLATLLQW
ncbi:hypothetical protein HanHA89_Chr11g0450321 [Helianthus annuus]|nr:hypothetical protein HanHA89_Chr11g0450321 [Helianthus annuus]